MDSFLLVVVCGGLTALLLPAAANLAASERYKAGSILSILALVLMGVSGGAWTKILAENGKSIFLFGILRYPAEGIICSLLFASCVLCTFVNVKNLIGRTKAVG